jgi:hypothetical protein
LNDIGRNSLLGNRKKMAKFLMRTFTCRSTFLYASVPFRPRTKLKRVSISRTLGMYEYDFTKVEGSLVIVRHILANSFWIPTALQR